MKDEGDVYRRLQEHLDELPVGYPATGSGVERPGWLHQR
jgi:hypothetical protein